jgi:hypothetical protein
MIAPACRHPSEQKPISDILTRYTLQSRPDGLVAAATLESVLGNNFGQQFTVCLPDRLGLFSRRPIIPATAFCVPSAMFLALELTLKLGSSSPIMSSLITICSPRLVRRQFDLSNDFSVMAKTASFMKKGACQHRNGGMTGATPVAGVEGVVDQPTARKNLTAHLIAAHVARPRFIVRLSLSTTPMPPEVWVDLAKRSLTFCWLENTASCVHS